MLSVPTTLFLFLFLLSTHPTTHNPPRQPPQPYPQQFSSRPACAPRFCRFNLSAAQCTREKTEANIQAKTKFHNPQILPAFPHFGVGLLFKKTLHVFSFFHSLSLSHTFRRAGVELGRFQVSSAQRVNEGMIRLTAYQLYMRRICDLLCTCVNKCRKCQTMFMSPESASKTNMQAKRERKKQGRPCIEFVHLPHLFSDCHRTTLPRKKEV